MKTGNLRGQMQVYDKPIFLFYAEHTYITGESIGFTEVWFESVQKALDNLFADMGDHVIRMLWHPLFVHSYSRHRLS